MRKISVVVVFKFVMVYVVVFDVWKRAILGLLSFSLEDVEKDLGLGLDEAERKFIK